MHFSSPKGEVTSKTSGDVDAKGSDAAAAAAAADADAAIEEKMEGDEMGGGEGGEGERRGEGGEGGVEQFVSWEPRSDTM